MFFAALGIFELIFLGVFFLLLVLGTAFDRHGKEDPKWWIFGVGFIAVAIWFWPEFTFFGDAVVKGTDGKPDTTRVVLWEAVTAWSFWKPVGAYLLAGLVYSILEFVLDIRRSARFYADEWKRHLTRTRAVPVLDEAGKPTMRTVTDRHGNETKEPAQREKSYGEYYANVKEKGAESADFNKALEFSKEFISSYRFKNRIIELQINEDDRVTVEPRVNRIELAEHVGAWTFMWPAYLVSLIIGDLLTEVFNAIADFLATISGRFVRFSFANVFKF